MSVNEKLSITRNLMSKPTRDIPNQNWSKFLVYYFFGLQKSTQIV